MLRREGTEYRKENSLRASNEGMVIELNPRLFVNNKQNLSALIALVIIFEDGRMKAPLFICLPVLSVLIYLLLIKRLILK